ncbi:MAG: PPC domain-containing DNA-binding protein [Planctomycetota bacterium]|jgi:predicted DNA-binding protein with PD1-like motif
MEYGVGKIGRVIVARGFEGEDVYKEIESLAAGEKIRAAAVIVLGGLRRGKVVVGPKSPTGPIEPNFLEFDDAREIAGVGTIFPDDSGEPSLHLHGAIGRGDKTLAGCPRGGATVFCVLEVILF